jgi:TRAP transporter TAXI family solute receptor
MLTKKGVRGCWILSIAVFLTLSGLDPSFAAEKKAVTWGTTSNTSGLFTYFVVTAKILNDKIPEINITVRSTGAGVHNARLMEKREVDMGAIETGLIWNAMQGTEPFKGKPNPDLRLLYVNMTNPLQFVVSEKSGIKDVYGLEGKMCTPGMLGSGAERAAIDIFKILGLQPKLRHMSYADAIEAMKDERIVGFVKYGVPDASILDVASAMKIRILSFSDSDLDKIIKNMQGFRKCVVPQGMYPGVGEFKALENEWGDYVGKDFPPELAYKVVKTIWEYRSEIKKSSPMFVGDRLVDVALGVKIGYLHPGAIKFYRELGFTVPKNLVAPEMGEK